MRESEMERRLRLTPNLAAFINDQCCLCRNGACDTTSRACDVLAPDQPVLIWTSPMDALDADRVVRSTRETSGDGRCTWFDKALKPIVPPRLMRKSRKKEKVDARPKPKRGRRKPRARTVSRAGQPARPDGRVQRQPRHR